MPKINFARRSIERKWTVGNYGVLICRYTPPVQVGEHLRMKIPYAREEYEASRGVACLKC